MLLKKQQIFGWLCVLCYTIILWEMLHLSKKAGNGADLIKQF